MRKEWAPAFGASLSICEPRVDVTEEQLLRVHSKRHLAKVNAAFTSCKWRFGLRVQVDDDTYVSAGTQAAASRAAGLVVAAVDDILGDGNVIKYPEPSTRPRRAFVMVRPPGHHAEVDSPQGFCLYNNVLVGAAHAQAVHGVTRVAILDFDVHHGNGDADISSSDPTLLYVSSHETPSFPGTGETPGREGQYRNVVNAPLPAEAGSSAFRRVWYWKLLPAVRAFRPDAIFLSAGFDAHADDPLSSVRLADGDFAWLTAEVAALGKPIISVLEGGYNLTRLEASVRTHVDALIHS